ncbi:MAG: hypothetical protein LM587_03195 [Candidatus Aenigmarchaeota archaeon]|nr:hypothetical protein [Candidatus Aenigmarchaeota archaeon]
MIIKPAYEPIHRLNRFMYRNSAYVEVWSDGFDYGYNFEDNLLDLLVNCNEIENIDGSKFIVYIRLSKFCPNIHFSTLPFIAFPNILETNHLENLTAVLMYYKKRVTIDMETDDLESHSCSFIVVENNLLASIFVNLLAEYEYEDIPEVVFANSFAYYLCLLF